MLNNAIDCLTAGTFKWLGDKIAKKKAIKAQPKLKSMNEVELEGAVGGAKDPKWGPKHVKMSKGLIKEGLGKISGKEYVITKENIDFIEKYLTEQGFIRDYENISMLNRLKDAFIRNQKITGADAVFYTHEIKEAELVILGE